MAENFYLSTTDQVYFNCVLTNTDPVNPIPARYVQDRSVSIVDNPSNYYLSVVRFTIPLRNIPLFEFRNNYFAVTLGYNADKYVQYVAYQSVGNITRQFVYVYQHMVDMINTALGAAFTALKAAHPAAAAVNPPYLVFDPSAKKFSLLVPNVGYNTGYSKNANLVDVYLNNELVRLFEGFNYFFYRTGDVVPQATARFVVENIGDNLLYTYDPNPANDPNGVYYSNSTLPGNTYYKMTQNYTSLYAWTDTLKILLATSLLPTRGEFLPTGQNDSSSNPTFKIITDYEPITNEGGEIRSIVQYIAGTYRLIDMLSTTPLNTLDVQVYLQLNDLSIVPVNLEPYDTMSIKLLFQRKGVPYAQSQKFLSVRSGV